MSLLLLLIISGPDAVFLDHSVTLDLTRADSHYTETSEERIVPLTARGVRRYGSISATYWKNWEDLEVIASVTHWRPGRGADTAEVREEPHSSLLPGGRLESLLRELHMDFPGLEVGDTLEVVITRDIRRLPLGGFYSYTYYAASSDSIAGGTLRLVTGGSDTIHWTVTGEGISHSEHTDSDGLRNLIWTTGPMPPLYDLPFSIGPAFRSPRVSVAGSTAEDVSRGLYRALVEDKLVGDEEKGAEILLDSGGEPSSICGWVNREIDYLSGLWGEDPGYAPRTPEETLLDMSGVCRDRAVLLIWLLRLAGHAPFAVLTSMESPIGPFPGSRSFDHMLVGMETADGDTVFLDPSNPYSPEGQTYTLRGREYLPLTPEGSSMERFPDPPEGDTLSICVSGTLDREEGTITGDLAVSFSGSAEELFRSMLSSVPAESMPQLLQRLFGASAGSRLRLEGDPGSLGSEVTVLGQGVWNAALVSGDGRNALILPGLHQMDLVGARASALLLPAFRSDVFIETPYTARLRLELRNFPGNALLPAGTDLNKYSLSIFQRGDTLVMLESLELLPLRPDSSQLAQIRRGAMEALSSPGRTVMLP